MALATSVPCGRRRESRATIAWALAAVTIVGACRAHPAATTPNDDPARIVSFDGGTLLVEPGACETVDAERVREWADRAYADMAEAWPDRLDRFRVSTLRMTGERDPRTSAGPVNGYWDRARSTIVFRCGVEEVVRHELLHVWCERAELPCDCKRFDHPDGYDLHCRPAGG